MKTLFFPLILCGITLPCWIWLFWHFPLLLISLVYPFPFLITFWFAFYAKLMFGIRLRRKSLFALSNIALYSFIPLGVHYTRFEDTNFFLYGFFYLFLSIPISPFMDKFMENVYRRLDILGQIFKLPQKKSTLLTIQTLHTSCKINPLPSFNSDLQNIPEDLYVFLWLLPGLKGCFVFLEEQNDIFWVPEHSTQIFPLPESLVKEEAIPLFFKKYPNLVLYGQILPHPITIGQRTLKNYVLYDICPKYKGQTAKPFLPWQEIQSICKIFQLQKIGEMGAFKEEKLRRILETPPTLPEGLSSAYLRRWLPDSNFCYYQINQEDKNNI